MREDKDGRQYNISQQQPTSCTRLRLQGGMSGHWLLCICIHLKFCIASIDNASLDLSSEIACCGSATHCCIAFIIGATLRTRCRSMRVYKLRHTSCWISLCFLYVLIAFSASCHRASDSTACLDYAKLDSNCMAHNTNRLSGICQHLHFKLHKAG